MCAATCSWRVLMNLIRLPASAARTAILVCPHRPKMCSTPRSSRYFTSCCATRFCLKSSGLFMDAPWSAAYERVGNLEVRRDPDRLGVHVLHHGLGARLPADA